MDRQTKDAFYKAVKTEPFARNLKIELKEIEEGYSVCEMTFNPAEQGNIYEMAHGGAVFGLIDEAFETASNSHGTVAVALNVNVTYIASPKPMSRLRAEAKEISLTGRIATYDIKVHDQDNNLIATCQALAYRKKDRVPFL